MDLSACPPIPLVTDEALLRVSRTHKSALLEDPAQFGVGPGEALKNELLSYKRMELEGDSILFNQVTINLLRKYKTLVTGSATAIRGTLCGNVTLAHFGRHYRLGEELILGPEARVLGLHLTPNTLADAFQARVAAVFRDFRRTGRLAEAERWLEDLFSPQVFPSLVAYVEIKRKEAIAHEFRATHGKGVDKNKKREKIYEDEADTQGRFGETIQWRTRPPRRDSGEKGQTRA